MRYDHIASVLEESNKFMQHWWNVTSGEDGCTSIKTCPSAALPPQVHIQSPGIEYVPPRLKVGNKPLDSQLAHVHVKAVNAGLT